VDGTADDACGSGGGSCVACQGNESCVNKACAVAVCGPSSCPNGCCQGTKCLTGDDNSACGKDGVACVACKSTEICSDYRCVAGTCDASTCPSGCCDAKQCKPGDTKAFCGTGGAACTACTGTDDCVNKTCTAPPCGPATCAGCCDSSGTCQKGDTTAACGTGGNTCTACAKGMTCSAGKCDADPTSEWKVTVVSAEILKQSAGGKVWDQGALPGFVEPDVYVKVTSGGNSGKTKTKDNTYLPMFNQQVLTAKAKDLGQAVKVEVYDEDPIPPDQLIGSCNVTFSGTDLQAGSFTLNDCGGTDAKNVKFSFAPK
jgi:hypothetical protein